MVYVTRGESKLNDNGIQCYMYYCMSVIVGHSGWKRLIASES